MCYTGKCASITGGGGERTWDDEQKRERENRSQPEECEPQKGGGGKELLWSHTQYGRLDVLLLAFAWRAVVECVGLVFLCKCQERYPERRRKAVRRWGLKVKGGGYIHVCVIYEKLKNTVGIRMTQSYVELLFFCFCCF